MSAPIVRVATGADAAGINAVVDAGFASYAAWAGPQWRPPAELAEAWPSLLGGSARPDRAWVADAGGAVAGVARTSTVSRAIPRPGEGGVILRHLFVAQAWWGTGVADRLLAAAVDAARADRFTAIWLATPALARQARRFYERNGFSERSHHRDAGLDITIVLYVRAL